MIFQVILFVIQVVPRLPFQNPQEPLTKKINQELNQEGKNAFYDYQLPMAIIRLKQALGRSMRREHQRSLTLVLDRRIVGKAIWQTDSSISSKRSDC